MVAEAALESAWVELMRLRWDHLQSLCYENCAVSPAVSFFYTANVCATGTHPCQNLLAGFLQTPVWILAFCHPSRN